LVGVDGAVCASAEKGPEIVETTVNKKTITAAAMVDFKFIFIFVLII
jgi:hypothetical protein